MTDETKTPEQLAAEAAAAAQDASAEKPAPEVAADAAASQDPAADPADAPETAAAEFDEAPAPGDLQPGQTLAALRGIPAGPAPHPRSHHRHA